MNHFFYQVIILISAVVIKINNLSKWILIHFFFFIEKDEPIRTDLQVSGVYVVMWQQFVESVPDISSYLGSTQGICRAYQDEHFEYWTFKPLSFIGVRESISFFFFKWNLHFCSLLQLGRIIKILLLFSVFNFLKYLHIKYWILNFLNINNYGEITITLVPRFDHGFII